MLSGKSVEDGLPLADSALPTSMDDGRRADLTSTAESSLKFDAAIATVSSPEPGPKDPQGVILGLAAEINATTVVEGKAYADQAYSTQYTGVLQAAEGPDTVACCGTSPFFPPSLLFTSDDPGQRTRVTAKAVVNQSPWSRRASCSGEAQGIGTTAERLRLTELVARFELEPEEEVSWAH